MGRYQAYPEYRDSGFDWLGEVPSGWLISKFGFVKTVLTDYTANGSFADLKKNVDYLDEPSYARLVRLTDLRMNLENENGVWIDEKAYTYLNKSALFGGEFLLANVGAYAGLFYQMPFGKGRASLAPNMFMAKFEERKVNSRFMAYVGQSDPINQQLRLNATASSAQPKLNKDNFKAVVFTYPIIEDQLSIANFLDHETAKIDTLIEQQQQLIQLLKEKRQAVISHAVTKGLNPSAPMKDSGVEWTDQVPSHWKVTKLRYYAVVSNGATPNRENEAFWHNGNVGWLNSSKVNDQIIESADQFITELAVLKTSVKAVKENDLVMAITGEGQTRGRVAVCKIDATINQHLASISLINSLLMHEFLYIWLVANYERIRFESNGAGSTKGAITCGDIESFPVVVPPINEQHEILALIKNETVKFDELEAKAVSAIELMKERRTALISAAVTGKIDVRNWQAPQQ